MSNERERKSYFGALNVLTGRVIIKASEDTRAKNVVSFLKDLLKKNPGKKITLFWDGASSHRSQAVKAFLHKVNQGKKGLDARLLLIRLAPNAPEENPIEDIWLQGKNHIRRTLNFNGFADVQAAFKQFIGGKKFSFGKIEKHKTYYK